MIPIRIAANLIGLIVFSAGLPAVGAERELPGHVPAIVPHLTTTGRLPATNQLRLAIGLPLRKPAELDEFLRQLSDPASPNFRKFLTPAEFTARFGPTESDYLAVQNFAHTNGLTVTARHGNRLLLDVSGPVSAVEGAFHITLRTYRHPSEQRDFFAPDTEPTVDVSLPVADVSGLDNYSRPHPNLHPQTAAVKPLTGSAPDGYSYFGDDFRAAYVPGTTLTGAGQSVGLFQLEGFYASDIATYASLAGGGRTNIAIQTVLLDGASGAPNTSDPNGIAEVSLDIEMSMAMAPGLSQIVVFEGNQSFFIPNDILNAMAASNTVRNLSSSWSWGGGPSTTTDNIFKTMAAQGQSFFVASGDSDAYPSGYVDNSSNTTAPVSSPYLTSVGGTMLTTTGPDGSYVSETTWNRNNGVGSSGGTSSYYKIPGWQASVSMVANGGSVTNRNLPDVALTAEYVYVKYDLTSGAYGGTSCAAPLWAGFLALVNQQAEASGQAPVGFINPAIYELANESVYSTIFNDTTTGNNTSSSSPNAFYAVPGYDLCTGLGTPAGTNLINAILNPDPLVVVTNVGFNAVGTPAGTFNISSQVFFLTNAGSAALTWTCINTSAWLNVSNSGGTLAGGASDTATISLSPAAGNLNIGTYSATLWFSNVTSGVAHYRSFTVTAADPLVVQPTNGFYFIGPAGGPFAASAPGITLSNARSNSLSWGINNPSPWFNVSPMIGNLSPGGQSVVAITPTLVASNLANGIYNVVLQVTNLASQFVQVVTGSVLVGQSLVQNGGFETGDYTSWSLSGNTTSFSVISGNSSFVHSGTYGARLKAVTTLGYLSQTIPTVPGQLYLLSLWMNSSSNPSGSHKTTPNEFSVVWNGTTLYDFTNVGVTGWTNLHFVVNASSSNTSLKIGARDDNYYLGLDDVSALPGFAPMIFGSPTNQTLFAGGNVTFTATATGSTALGYQWRKNGTNLVNGSGIAGATTNLLALTSVTTNSSGIYSLVVTNAYGTVSSNLATLTVVVPASFTGLMSSRTLECGRNTNIFSINAVGTAPLLIQWSLDGMPLVGATNSSCPLTNLTLPSHILTVVVTNFYGSATSNAVLAVQDTTPPVITLNGFNPMTNELGSMFNDPGATANDACSGPVAVGVSGSVNVNALGTNVISYQAIDGNGNTAIVTRTVLVRDTTPPAILWSFTNLILAANANCSALLTNLTGTNFIRVADLSGTVTISQWPTNNAILPLGTNQIVLTVKDASGNAAYSTNNVIVLDKTPPVIALIGNDLLTNELGSAFADPGLVATDNCSGILSVETNGSVNISAVGASTLTYIATDNSGNTNFVVRTVIVRDTTPPTILWCFTNLVVALDTNCSAVMPDVTGTNFILATDLSEPLSILQSPTNNSVLQPGTNLVVIAIADLFGNATYSTNFITVSDLTAPAITSQPQSLTNNSGETASFNVAATACTPLAFQWFFGGSILTNQNSSSLTLSNLTAAAAGNYSVVLTSSGGATTSVVAMLTVNNILATSMTLNSSANPAGFNDNLNFTAVVTPSTTTGTIQFFTNGAAFDLEPLVAGSAISADLSILPRGTNLITAVYSGDANDWPSTNTLEQIVTNHPPVVLPAFYTLIAGLDLNLAVAELATNWSDADGDALFIASISASTNGVIVTNALPSLFYSNSNYVDDQLVCAISDGNGGTNYQTVNIFVVPQTNSIPNISAIGSQPPGAVSLSLDGGFGSTYVLESTTDFVFGVWLPVATNTLGVTGTWQFTDTEATNFPQRFFRLKRVP